MAKKPEGWNIVGLNYKDDLEKALNGWINMEILIRKSI